MIVEIKKLNEKAQIPFKKYDSDFCYDCVATSVEEIAPNVYKYGLGFALSIVRNKELIEEEIIGRSEEDRYYAKSQYLSFQSSPCKLSIDIRPRSSVYKTGMILANTTGTVDESYRGEICCIFYHVMPDMPKYEVGDRIAQLKLGFTLPIEFKEVDELGATERGCGGFGSTGK